MAMSDASRGDRRRRVRFLLLAAILLAASSACVHSPAEKELALEWYGVGNAWLAAGKYAEAGKAYDRAMTLDPKLVAASYNAAHALVEAGSYDRAIGIADTLIAGESGNIRYIGLRAYALYKAGRIVEATTAYEAAFALDQWAPDIIYNSSLLLVEAGKAATAAERLAPLVETKPDNDVLITLYARALTAAGRDSDAIAEWEDLRSLNKIDAESLESLGTLYAKSGDDAKALEALSAATDKDPKRPSAWFALARLKLTVADDGEGGLAALGKALEAGFADRDAAKALLSEAHLVERDAVAKALTDKQLIDTGGTEAGTATPPAGTSTGAAGSTPAGTGTAPTDSGAGSATKNQ